MMEQENVRGREEEEEEKEEAVVEGGMTFVPLSGKKKKKTKKEKGKKGRKKQVLRGVDENAMPAEQVEEEEKGEKNKKKRANKRKQQKPQPWQAKSEQQSLSEAIAGSGSELEQEEAQTERGETLVIRRRSRRLSAAAAEKENAEEMSHKRARKDAQEQEEDGDLASHLSSLTGPEFSPVLRTSLCSPVHAQLVDVELEEEDEVQGEGARTGQEEGAAISTATAAPSCATRQPKQLEKETQEQEDDSHSDAAEFWKDKFYQLLELRETDVERDLHELRQLCAIREAALQSQVTAYQGKLALVESQLAGRLGSASANDCTSSSSTTTGVAAHVEAADEATEHAAAAQKEYISYLEEKVEKQRQDLFLYQMLSSTVIKPLSTSEWDEDAGSVEPEASSASSSLCSSRRSGRRVSFVDSNAGIRMGAPAIDEDGTEQATPQEVGNQDAGDAIQCTVVNHMHRKAARFNLLVPRNLEDAATGNICGEDDHGESRLDVEYVPVANVDNFPQYMQHKLRFDSTQTPIFLHKVLQALFAENQQQVMHAEREAEAEEEEEET